MYKSKKQPHKFKPKTSKNKNKNPNKSKSKPRAHKSKSYKKTKGQISRKALVGIDDYKILVANNINISEFKKYFGVISALNMNITNIGYITMDSSYKFYNGQTFLIFKNGVFLGIVFFRNKTYEFKKTILGATYVNDKDFKCNSNINIYMMDWILSNNIMTKSLLQKIIKKFQYINNLLNSNIVIVKFSKIDWNKFNYSESFNNNDILFKYKSLIEYNKSAEYENLIKIGFTYNGYNVTMHNEQINIYSIRFLKKLYIKDFFPLYIITRQFKNMDTVNLNGLKSLWHLNKIISIDNYIRFALSSSLVYYTNTYDSGLIYNGTPYNYMFINNFISNKLGNDHIVSIYSLFYYALIDSIDSLGINNKNLKYFCEVINSFEKAIKHLETKKNIIYLKDFNIAAYAEYFIHSFSDKDIFINFINENQNKALYGYYALNYNFIKKIFPLKTNTMYNITGHLVFTYINNKFECYLLKYCGLLIFTHNIEIYYSNKTNEDFAFLVPPKSFFKSFNEYASRPVNLEHIYNEIRKICTIIGKVYKKYANLNINQINGFKCIHTVFRLIEDNNEITPILLRLNPNFVMSNTYNNEQSQYLNEIIYKPAFTGIKTTRTEMEYQPLNIDDDID